MNRPKKFCVSGSRFEIPRVTRVMDHIRRLGGEITFDWTETVEQEYTADACQLADAAERCCLGVKLADHVIFLLDHRNAQRGTHVEFGIALGLATSIIKDPKYRISVVDSKLANCFYFHPAINHHFSHDAALLEYLTLIHR